MQVDEASIKEADPHEIMTACCCLLDKSKLQSLNDLNKQQMDELIQQLSEIASSSRLVGKNEKKIQSISTSSIRYDALCQAISAAKEIVLNHWNSNNALNYVILVGDKWHSDVSQFAGIQNLLKFGIDSHGMKDFNSSDIILCDKSQMVEESDKNDQKFNCLGISLKKKGASKNAADPTMLNRSIIDALVGDQSTENQKKLAEKINNAFGEFYNNILHQNAEKFVKNNNVVNKLSQSAFYKKMFKGSEDVNKDVEDYLIEQCKNAKEDDWKEMFSETRGIMCTHDNRAAVREVVNKQLGSSSSVFKLLLDVVQQNSTFLANQLIALIYKGDLKTLIDFNFDFGVCVGRGEAVKKKDDLQSRIEKAEYIPIQTVEKNLSQLQSEGMKAQLVSSKKQKDFENRSDDIKYPAKLFLDLDVCKGSERHTIANIEIRYKGSYTSSPQVFAVMSEEFKQYLTTSKW